MKVAKWGNSLAVRLPAAFVARLGIKEGDEVDISGHGGVLEIERKEQVGQAFRRLKSFRGRLPADFKFDREEANSRGRDDDE